MLKKHIFILLFILIGLTSLINAFEWERVFYDDCSNFNNWDQVGGDLDFWVTAGGGFRNHHNREKSDLVLKNSIDLSSYALVRVSWKQWTQHGSVGAGDFLYYQVSADGGVSWSNKVETLEGFYGETIYSFMIPANYLTANFKIKFFLEGFDWSGGPPKWCAIDDITIEVPDKNTPGNIIFVDDDYTDAVDGWNDYRFDNITDALVAVEEGGFIFVYSGIYNERITVNKSIYLVGEHYSNVVINGGSPNNSSNVVTLNNSDIYFQGFRITGSGITGWGAGLSLSGTVNNSTISNLVLNNNRIGLNLETANNNVFHTLSIVNSNVAGLRFNGWATQHNLFYNNYFQNETQFVGSEPPNNKFNIDNINLIPGPNIIGGQYIGGNFWSDYEGEDRGDGFGVPAYAVHGHASAKDNLPLIYPSGTSGDYYIRLEHSEEALISQNVPITISIRRSSDDSIVTEYDETMYISTSGIPNYITWSNSTGNGTLNTSIQGMVEYDFIPADNGEITLLFKYNDIGTIYFSAYSLTLYGNYITEFDSAPLIITFGDVFYVDDDYNASTSGWDVTHFNNITDALNAVVSKATIYVYEGIYNENITIDKPVLLRGESADNVILNHVGNNTVIKITSNDVEVSGLTVNGSKGSWGNSCILLDSVSNIYIYDNKLNNSRRGITVSNSPNNVIHSNYILNSSDEGGIRIEGWEHSVNNTVYNNYFKDNVANIVGSGANPNNYFNIAKSSGTNIKGGPYLGGNYYSDYFDKYPDAVDRGDGFGDQPYIIISGTWQDNLPLVKYEDDTEVEEPVEANLRLEIEEKDYYIAGKIYYCTVSAVDSENFIITDYNATVTIRQTGGTVDVFYITPETKNRDLIVNGNSGDITFDLIDGISIQPFYYNDAGTIKFRVYNADSDVYSNTQTIQFIPEYFEVEIHDYNPANIEIAGNYCTFTVRARGSSDGPGTNELLENFNSTINFTPVYEEPDTGTLGFSKTSSSISNGVAIVSLYYPDAGEIRIHVEDSTYHQDTTITGTSEILTFRPDKFNIDIEYWGSRYFFYKCEFFRNVKITAVNIYDTKTPNYSCTDIKIVGIDGLDGSKLWGDTFVFDASDSGLKEIKFKFFSETSGIYHLTVKDEINIIEGDTDIKIKKATLKLYDVSGRAGDTVTVQVKMIDDTGNIITEDNYTRFTVSGIHSPDLRTEPDSILLRPYHSAGIKLNEGAKNIYISSKYDTTVFAEPVLNIFYEEYPMWNLKCDLSSIVSGGYISFTQTKLKVIDSWLHVNNISTPDTLIARVELLNQFNNKVKWGQIEPLRYSIILPDDISDSYILISDTDDLKIVNGTFFDTFVIVRKSNATLETFQIAPVTSQANPDTGTIQFLDRPRNIRIFYKQERGSERR